MNTPPGTTSPKRPLSIGDRTSLLSQAQGIKRDIPAATRSLAARTRVTAHVSKLCDQVLELDPAEAIEQQSRAMQLAMGKHDWDELAAACEAFAQAFDAKPMAAPIGEMVGLAADPVAASPAPIIAAPLAVADPVPDHSVPVRAPADPDRDHTEVIDPADANATKGGPMAVAGLATVEQLGEAIRAARTGKRMTQLQAANAAGVGRRFVIELEHGKPTAEIGCVLAVCRAVGVALTVSPS